MKNNITRIDLNSVINFLKKNNQIITQSSNVKKFEKLWSNWLGVKFSTFVNSGSSANLMSISYLKYLYPKGGEIITSPFNWPSDINSIISNGFKPIFVDIDFKNLSANDENIISKVSYKTKAVLLTHAQGFNGLTSKLITELKKRKIHLIEDVCESHGATFKNKKLGSFGLISNFSFYYAHHMSTIEGGMICTNSKEVDNYMKSIRSHGFLREINDKKLKKNTLIKYKDLNSKFIFLYPGFNFRNTEIGAIIGISQLKKLNKNIALRNRNNKYFVSNIDSAIFFTDFDMIGSSNYAFNLILRKKNILIPLSKKYNVGIFGPYWTLKDNSLRVITKYLRKFKFDKFNQYLNDLRISIPYERERDYYFSSKICINFHEKENITSHYHKIINQRTFKIAACGGFQICDDIDNIHDYFSNEEIVTAKSIEDWFEKIDYFIENNKERNKIREKSYIKCQENHMYEHRIQQILTMNNLNY